MSQTDGIEEALEGQVRLAVTFATQLGEAAARSREDALQRARAASESEQRDLAARLEAERAVMRATVAPARDPGWWAAAQPRDIQRVYQAAHAWHQEDPEAAVVYEHMRRELAARYGVDAGTVATPAPERELAHHERADAAADRATASALMHEADVEDEAALAASSAAAHEHGHSEDRPDVPLDPVPVTSAAEARAEASAEFDSAERREALANQLERAGVGREAAESRLLADRSQGRPATEAVAAPKARSTTRARRTTGRSKVAQRGDRAR